MINKTNNKQEFNHFHDLSEEWWLPNGKFKTLHSITPLRIKYIKNNIGLPIENNIHNNEILKDIDILDLGCGGGLVCEPLARLGAKITGIDFVKENIEIAKKHAKTSSLKIEYMTQNISSINLKNKFEVILVLEVIEHIYNWENVFIKIIKKYLKPNGKIIFSTINRTALSKIFAIFFAENILKWIPKKTHQHDKFVKPEELINFLERSGMQVTDTTGLFFNPLTREWVFNKQLTHINYFCTAKKIN